MGGQPDRGRPGPAHAAPDDPLASGRTLFGEAGCNACHALADANAVGEIGPDLDGIGSRAGATVAGESAEDYLLNSIVKPNVLTSSQAIRPTSCHRITGSACPMTTWRR